MAVAVAVAAVLAALVFMRPNKGVQVAALALAMVVHQNLLTLQVKAAMPLLTQAQVAVAAVINPPLVVQVALVLLSFVIEPKEDIWRILQK
jgi:hypothetical protein